MLGERRPCPAGYLWACQDLCVLCMCWRVPVGVPMLAVTHESLGPLYLLGPEQSPESWTPPVLSTYWTLWSNLCFSGFAVVSSVAS